VGHNRPEEESETFDGHRGLDQVTGIYYGSQKTKRGDKNLHWITGEVTVACNGTEMTVEGYRNPQSVTDDQRWLKITQRKSEKTQKGSQTLSHGRPEMRGTRNGIKKTRSDRLPQRVQEHQRK
jgi:hypothetical protein